MTRADRVVAVVAMGGTLLAATWFALHPQPLLLGVAPQPELVPWWYQATAFPPFFVLASGLVAAPRRARPRWLLLGVAGALALVRLAGWVPLSGHGTFLSACLVFAWRSKAPYASAVWWCALLGLLVTTVLKVRWGDELFFAASLGAGVVLGLGCRWYDSRLNVSGQPS